MAKTTFDTNPVSLQTLLKNCATKPEMYYEVSSAAQLSSVFTSIAQNLANLRLAK